MQPGSLGRSGDPGTRCAAAVDLQECSPVSAALQAQGHPVSERTVNRLLHDLGLQSPVQPETREGRAHPDRDAPFHHIPSVGAKAFQKQGQPVVSVETKKKGLSAHSAMAGVSGNPRGSPRGYRATTSRQALGKVIPYGVYTSDEHRLGQRGGGP